jgi:hypothetical protein
MPAASVHIVHVGGLEPGIPLGGPPFVVYLDLRSQHLNNTTLVPISAVVFCITIISYGPMTDWRFKLGSGECAEMKNIISIFHAIHNTYQNSNTSIAADRVLVVGNNFSNEEVICIEQRFKLPRQLLVRHQGKQPRCERDCDK